MTMENYLQKLKSKLREGETYRVTPADTKSSSGVMKLAFKGPNPEECKQVLQSIVATFEDHIRDTTKNVGGENADLVQRAQENWLDRLKVATQQINGSC